LSSSHFGQLASWLVGWLVGSGQMLPAKRRQFLEPIGSVVVAETTVLQPKKVNKTCAVTQCFGRSRSADLFRPGSAARRRNRDASRADLATVSDGRRQFR